MNSHIIIIGMPGSGKTTVGTRIAKQLGWHFIDTDQIIIRLSGKTIPELFEKGEPHFREWELKAISSIQPEKPCIISTGGGVVTQPATMKKLQSLGKIVHLERSIDHILESLSQHEERPLLQGDHAEKLHRLFNERQNLYCQYRNHQISNDSSFEETIQKISGLIHFLQEGYK